MHLCAQLCLTLLIPWTVSRQAPLSMRVSRREYWSGLPCPPLVDLPDPGIELASLMSSAFTGRYFTTSTTWEAQYRFIFYSYKSIPHFIVLCRNCIIYKLKVCCNSASKKSISIIIFLTHLLTSCPCHTLVILAIFQTFSSLCLLW